jgi:hypothetical protein
MQPTQNAPPSPVVNWSILGQLIDQLPAAVVVVNGPPFRGPLITRRQHHLHWPRHMQTKVARWPAAAVVGYAVVAPTGRINHRARHRSTTMRVGVSLLGGMNVVS